MLSEDKVKISHPDTNNTHNLNELAFYSTEITESDKIIIEISKSDWQILTAINLGSLNLQESTLTNIINYF